MSDDAVVGGVLDTSTLYDILLMAWAVVQLPPRVVKCFTPRIDHPFYPLDDVDIRGQWLKILLMLPGVSHLVGIVCVTVSTLDLFYRPIQAYRPKFLKHPMSTPFIGDIPWNLALTRYVL